MSIVPSYDATIHVRDNCLCLHTQRAARSLARRFDEVLRPFGLTNGQFSLLNAVNRPKPPQMKVVASLLGMDRTTLTAAIKPLERRGLMAVAPDPNDRRSRKLSLTEAGKETLAAALPVWESTHAAIDATLANPDAIRAALNILSEQ